MTFHFAGKFDGDESKLPHREHPKGYVPFKEPGMKTFAILANGGAIVLLAVLLAVWTYVSEGHMSDWSFLAIICSVLSLVPHEFLHGVCFREDVYMYTNLKQGMLFVIGGEEMSKGRFVFMSLLPNLVFGVLPYAVYLAFPHLTGLGLFGAFCLSMGFCDYINVFNALTQMPKGAKTYLCGFHSYWYIPEN